MKSFAIATVALAAGANAWNNATYTTQVVTSYTTYCPGPTSVVVGQKTYTVTKATTLTITDCPCTITKPVIPTLPTAVPVKSSSVPVVPVVPVVKTTTLAGGSVVVTTVTPPAVPVSTAVVVPAVTPVYSVPVVKGTSAPSAVPVTPTTPSAPIFTGAGNKAAASGLSLAGLAAVAAFFL